MMTTGKHFAVLYTGGTIGMRMGADGLCPSQDSVRAALAQQTDSERWSLTVCEPLIDSSHIRPAQWRQWQQWLLAQRCDGVLLLHGTDTLAYSANVLAFALVNNPMPVVMTGAQYPLGNALGDAEANLQAAVAALWQGVAPGGVSVVFDGELWPALGCRKISTRSVHGFGNKNSPAIARWQKGVWQHLVVPQRPACHSMESQAGIAVLAPPQLLACDARIACHYCLPTADQWLLRALLHSDIDALIIQSFGHGNGLFSAEDVAALRAFQDAGKVVVNVSQVADGEVAAHYAASSALRAAGVFAAGAWTVETAYAKLWVGLSMGLTGEALRQMLHQNWCGEWAS